MSGQTGADGPIPRHAWFLALLSWFARLGINGAALPAIFLTVGLVGSWIVAAEMAREAIATGRSATFATLESLGRSMESRWAQESAQISTLQRIGAIISRDALAGRKSAAAEEEVQQIMRATGPDVMQVAVMGADGKLLWSNPGMPAQPVDLSDREYFRAIAIDGKDNFSGSPVFDRESGQWTVQFLSAVRDIDRKLQAVVVVSVDATALRRMAGGLGQNFASVYSLVRNDGKLLMRSLPGQERFFATEQNPEIQIPVRNRGDNIDVKSSFDGIRRFYSRYPLPATDLILVAGMDEDAAMAPAWASERAIWLECGGLDAALLFAAAAALFAVQRNRILISERVRHAAIESRGSLMRHFAESASDLIALLDENFGFIYINPAFADTFGFDCATSRGVNVGRSVYEADLAIFGEAKRRLDAEGSAQRVIYRVRDRNGDLRWLETEVVRIEDDSEVDRDGLRYICVSRDITERKIAEQQLLEAQQDLNCLLAESGAVLFRDRYRYREGAPVELKLVGPLDGTILGAAIADFERPNQHMTRLDDASRALFEKMRMDCARNGHAMAELRAIDAAGKWRWLRVQCSRGAVTPSYVELLHFATDITDEHESRARREQTERLAVIGEVCAGIAHEMNQPLAVISMAAANGLLEMETVPFEVDFVAGKFRRIEAQALRIGKIIKHICGFGRLEVDQHEYFSVADAIEDALVIARSRMAAAQVTIEIDTASDTPQLFGARLVLEQVLMNLFVNACDAYLANASNAKPGAPRKLFVKARRRDAECVIEVADQAGGIRPDLLDKIFIPFVTTKATDHGTGLGLSYCAKAVHEMGGAIAVRNENGGAVFELRLPLRQGGSTLTSVVS